MTAYTKKKLEVAGDINFFTTRGLLINGIRCDRPSTTPTVRGIKFAVLYCVVCFKCVSNGQYMLNYEEDSQVE